MDPEIILAAADTETRTVKDEIADHADRVMRWLNAPVDVGHLPGNGHMPHSPPKACGDFNIDGAPLDEDVFMLCGTSSFLNDQPTSKRSRAKRRSDPGIDLSLPDPDLAPEGWISYKGPNGRVNWHHRSLGPAPWETDAAGYCTVNVKPTCMPRSTHATSFGPIISPTLPSNGWVYFERPDGRTFWHHVALGPAPWEIKREQPLHGK